MVDRTRGRKRMTPGKVMVLSLVAMVAVQVLGAWLSGRTGAAPAPGRDYRLQTGPELILYTSHREGQILRACPWLFAAFGLGFILGALWLAWQDTRNDGAT